MVKGYITRTTDDSTTKEVGYVATVRIISHGTWQYLNGIVGIGGWVNFAIALKGYADCRAAVSSEMVNRDDVYLMLMGYTLEDLAKCIISYRAYNAKPITKQEGVIPFEEKLKTLTFQLDNGETCSIKTHDLDKLYKAGEIGFAITDTEKEHLKAISRYTLWKGRYPVPLDINDVPASEPSFGDMDITARNIYDRAMAEVERLRSSRS